MNYCVYRQSDNELLWCLKEEEFANEYAKFYEGMWGEKVGIEEERED